MKAERKPGDLNVWWITKFPTCPFEVEVCSVEMGVKILDVLTKYDAFQFKHKAKPDYCNAGGIYRWCADSDGDGTPGWENWYDEETGEDDPKVFVSSLDSD